MYGYALLNLASTSPTTDLYAIRDGGGGVKEKDTLFIGWGDPSGCQNSL